MLTKHEMRLIFQTFLDCKCHSSNPHWADTTKESSEKKLCILDGNPQTTQKHSQDTDHCSSTKKE